MMPPRHTLLLLCLLSLYALPLACSDTQDATPVRNGDEDAREAADGDLDTEHADSFDGPSEAEDEADAEPERTLVIHARVVTFNTGTSEDLPHDRDLSDGYTASEAALSDEYYGNGLAWLPAVEAAKVFFATLDADIVTFQEIFHPGDCAAIPNEARQGFYCQNWSPGDPSVAEYVLGEGWQVMCHLGKPDKCAAVKRDFGSFVGCDDAFCLEGLAGARVEGCGSGSRIGRGVISLVNGGTLTLVNVHGSSGISADDRDCRRRQFEQVFVAFLDGAPAANGAINLIMGDFNTDPALMATSDISAARLLDFIGPDKAFHFISNFSEKGLGTYASLFNIDHVISDRLTGDCFAPGVSDGVSPVFEPIYFDHVPIVCDVDIPLR